MVDGLWRAGEKRAIFSVSLNFLGGDFLLLPIRDFFLPTFFLGYNRSSLLRVR